MAPLRAERTELGEPAAAPHPVAVDRIEEHRGEQAPDYERAELPALGHGPRGDGGRGVHEHQLEEEESEHGHVVGSAAQVEDEDLLVLLLFQPVGERGSGGLIDDPDDVEARDLTGIFGCLAL